MKLKTKLPLLFLLMFMLILFIFIVYLRITLFRDRITWFENISAPEHRQFALFLLIITGIVFVVLSVYFHFYITQPIMLLNTRLKKLNIGHSLTSLQTRRKDEIGELYEHFNEMAERLQQAHKEQINMIAAIAHDLKTPLTSINGFVELLALQKELPERERQEYFELILKKSKHIAELLNYFSAFTVVQLALETLEMKPVEAMKLFENIAAEYETELSGFDCGLNWKHTFKPNQCLMINEHMMRRVFGNLFSNSVRYGAKKDLHVYLNGYVQGEYAVFQIEDSGLGVPEGELNSLFQKFYMVDKSRPNTSGGSGLGLASCKSIIERHGGEIGAFSSKYGGLGIRFSIPLMI